MTSEHDYEEWFQKYLGNIESIYDYDVKHSPFTNTPKPFSRQKMLIRCGILVIIFLLISFGCSFFYEHFNSWILSWFSNIAMSFSIGLVASIVLLAFTAIKDRNSAFYADIIPNLEQKHENMHSAYFQYCNKLSIYFQQNRFEDCFDAWHFISNTSFVILNFLEYLDKILPYRPKCFTFSRSDIERAKHAISDADNQLRKECSADFHISKETYDACEKATHPAFTALMILQELIEEFKQNLYELQYGKKNIERIHILRDDNQEDIS